ncbi:Lipid A export ATP-binding/permease protein MsbA [Candidatus Hepatincola sp. Pdp]
MKKISKKKSMLKKILSLILRNDDPKELNSITKVLQRFAKDFMRPHLKKILISLFFLAIYSATNAGLAWLIKPIVNQVFIIKNMQYVLEVSLAIIGITVIKGIAQYIYTMILFAVSIYVTTDARNNLYKSILHQDMFFFHTNSPGVLVSRMMKEIDNINNLATEVPINIGRDFLTFIGLLVVMFILQPVYAAIILGSIFVIFIPIRLVTRKVKDYFKRTNTGYGQLTSHLEQSLNGIKEVKSYNMENKEFNTLHTIANSINRTQLKVRKVNSILSPLMETFAGVAIAFVLIYAGYQVAYHHADPGTFFSFIAALIIAFQPLKRLTTVTVKVQLGVLAIQRYYKLLDTKPLLKDKPNAKILAINSANLAFENVSFSYAPNKRILNNISFEIASGKKVALVGRSGGGKSTIINLAARFYEPNSGKILINGVNYTNYTTKSYRHHLAFVSQEVVLFDTSIFNNIAYSKEDATEEEVISASKKAACYDFIMKLPEQFNTTIGPRGIKLSGGQRQRISIARALLKQAPILLLDEATSALDTESEQAIQVAMEHLMKNKTTMIIAHRLSTIINCDTILVINDGEIVESGNHTTLLAQNGMYKYLYDLQFKEQEIISNSNNL